MAVTGMCVDIMRPPLRPLGVQRQSALIRGSRHCVPPPPVSLAASLWYARVRLYSRMMALVEYSIICLCTFALVLGDNMGFHVEFSRHVRDVFTFPGIKGNYLRENSNYLRISKNYPRDILIFPWDAVHRLRDNSAFHMCSISDACIKTARERGPPAFSLFANPVHADTVEKLWEHSFDLRFSYIIFAKDMPWFGTMNINPWYLPSVSLLPCAIFIRKCSLAPGPPAGMPKCGADFGQSGWHVNR